MQTTITPVDNSVYIERNYDTNRIEDTIQRVGSTEDIANALLFLLSDQANYITGTEIIVDGGLTAKP
jgi:NAD(P)-dependent dehydrogenase (short-subunit alcohol dehydrogenase family)